MPSGNEELIIRGSDGNCYIVTSDGNRIKITEGLTGFIVTTTGDPGSPVTGQVWFRTDV